MKIYSCLMFFLHQTSSSDIFVSWDSFTDVEEQGNSMHSSGINKYLISVGKYYILKLITCLVQINLVQFYFHVILHLIDKLK